MFRSLSAWCGMLLQVIFLGLVGFPGIDGRVPAQTIRAERELTVHGSVRSIKPGKIVIVTADGQSLDCKIQDKNEMAMMVGGTPVRLPATISVKGKLPARLLEKGMLIEFEGMATESGKATEAVAKVSLAQQNQTIRADFLKRPAPGEGAAIAIVGRVINVTRAKVYLQVPPAKWARQGRIGFDLTEDAVFQVDDDRLIAVRAGDSVRRARIVELSTGEKVILAIAIELTAERIEFTNSHHDRLEQQFRHLSETPPTEPRLLSSNYFALKTDLSDRNAQILLAKLDTMYELIAKYFGKRPQASIECYVVEDLRKWRQGELHPIGIAAIREGAGVTISTPVPGMSGGPPLGGIREMRSIVYSSANHGVCQHEAVHAFCAMTFGSTGPVWYAEGMAELGQYWKPDELAVNIDPVVIDYLTSTTPKKSLAEIVNAKEITGDSWEAYAWRWALCHLLANHPNYRKRFLALGWAMMLAPEDDSTQSFASTFGKMERQISFEYNQFIQNFGNGYRVDLCAWDWSVKPNALTRSSRLKQKVLARRGWQATKLKTIEGESYDFAAQGEWKLSPTSPASDAEGLPDGRGKLLGAILTDYQLLGPLELGARGSFVAPAKGQLFVRCADDWTELADNEGEVLLHLRLSKERVP